MAFTNDEIAEIKRRLKYGALTALARPYFDIALVFEEVVQRAISAEGQAYVTATVLPALRALDAQMAPDALAPFLLAAKVADAEVSATPLANLQRLRAHWLCVLSETVQVPIAQTRSAGGGSVEIE